MNKLVELDTRQQELLDKLLAREVAHFRSKDGNPPPDDPAIARIFRIRAHEYEELRLQILHAELV